MIGLFLLICLIVPVATVIYVAFTEKGTGAFTLVNFVDFARTDLFVTAFWNSVYVSAMSVLLASMFALPLAAITTRFEFRGAILIQTLGFVPLIMPPFAGAVAMQLLFGRNGTINLLLDDHFGFKIPFMEGLNGVVFVQAVHYFPFILVNLSAALRNIDRSMEEAAQNLGCSGFRLFRGWSFRWRCRATWRAPRSSSSRFSTISPRRCCSTSRTCSRRRPTCASPRSASPIRWAT